MIMKNTMKVERAKKNWTQADLADKIGVSRQAINSIETGKFVPSTVLALKMAKVFQTTVEVIFQLSWYFSLSFVFTFGNDESDEIEHDKVGKQVSVSPIFFFKCNNKVKQSKCH